MIAMRFRAFHALPKSEQAQRMSRHGLVAVPSFKRKWVRPETLKIILGAMETDKQRFCDAVQSMERENED